MTLLAPWPSSFFPLDSVFFSTYTLSTKKLFLVKEREF